MSALILAALNIAAPSLVGGSLGIVISMLRHPMANKFGRIAKGMTRGDHLSDEAKEFYKQYNAGRTDQWRYGNSYR